MADIKLKAGTPQTLEASGGSISNGAAGTADDADLDNTTALAPTYTFVLLAGFGSSVTAGEDIDLYLIPRVDGTNLADVGTGFADGHKTTIRLGATRRQHLIARFRGNR